MGRAYEDPVYAYEARPYKDMTHEDLLMSSGLMKALPMISSLVTALPMRSLLMKTSLTCLYEDII